nr:nonstructural protein 3 NS3 [Chaphamaparvovirus anseriform 8]
MSSFVNNGFTLLLWVDRKSSAFDGLEPKALKEKEKEYLEDAACLLGCRWSIEISFTEHNGILYAFGSCARFTVGIPTIQRALGDLSSYVHFHRGTAHDTCANLIRYKACKEKWRVPETVTEGGSGESYQEQVLQQSWKRKKQ